MGTEWRVHSYQFVLGQSRGPIEVHEVEQCALLLCQGAGGEQDKR